MSFTPTAEQQSAIDAALTGENLVITAGAGSGKTSTLRLIADALAPKQGVYIAYNKAIATDAAKSFPANVTCRTAHSFAYRAVGHRYKARLNAGRMTGRQIANALDITYSYPLGNDRELSTGRLASLIMQTVGKWCHSADDRILAKHAAALVADLPGVEEVSWELADYLANEAQRAWDTDLSKEHGKLPFSHDMYVKIWALSDPILPGDFALYDEAQDADPCIAGVVLAQQNMQLIAVGDECQAIYGWRGATDAMKNWPAKHRVALTQSFRFGQAVADEANVFLGLLNAPLRITGFDKIDSQVGALTQADAILCRTNASVIEEAMTCAERGVSFAVVGGMDQIKKFAEAAEALMQGKRASWHPDLGVFKNWDDVMEYVENDEGGADLRSMANIVDDFGPQALYGICSRAIPEDRAEVVLSTAHKSKGREWDSVKIAADFQPSEDRQSEGISRSECMLMYVAVTRAKKALDCSALSFAKSLKADA